MKENLTHIRFVLDRSGSMSLIRDSTIAGFNEFVEGQKNTPGECTMTLHQFDSDNPVEIVFENKPVKEITPLTTAQFRPRGATPLHDAIGYSISSLGRQLGSLPEADRPGKVIVVIMSDGLENASSHYTAPQISDLIKLQRETYKWEFLFLGANQDACMTGEKLNIPVANSITYAATAAGTHNVMAMTAQNVSRYRVTGQSASLAYSDEDRKEAEDKP